MEYIIIFFLVISLPFLFGALREGGHLKAPRIGRKSKTFRQFPTFPNQGGEESDY